MNRPVINPFTSAGLVLALLLCVAAYYPGLHGNFTLDDFPNIVQNQRLQVDTISVESLRQAALSSDSGTLKRPLSMLSFWANYYVSGLDPFYFKLTNLLIHLVNGLGLYWLTILLLAHRGTAASAKTTQDHLRFVAVATAGLWLLHPLNLTGVLYVVQRMASLAATFMIFGLICYVSGRRRLARGERGFPLILLGLFGFGALAVLSKENGALLPLYMGIIEFTLFRFADLAPRDRKRLRLFFLLTLAVPAVLAAAFIASHPHWLASQYQVRDFTLTERLLTEARVLWLYLRWLIVPTASSLGLFHDDIAVSHGLLDPLTTLISIVALVSATAAAVVLRKRFPWLAFAVFWFLGGHVLESSFIGLGLVFEHRNYLPIYGPVLAAVYALASALREARPHVRYGLPAALALALTIVTAERAEDWRSTDALAAALVRHHPDSPLANYEAGMALGARALKNPALGPRYYAQIKAYFERSTALAPKSVDGLFDLILLDATNARPIDGKVVERLSSRLASAPLSYTVVGSFRSLVSWMTNGSVSMPPDEVLHLFEAAIGNPTTGPQTKGALMSILSSYYFNVANDVQRAVGLAVAATKEDPSEPVNHLSLADIALQLGNYGLAAKELEAVQRNDLLGRFALRSERLAQALRQAQQKRE